MTLYQKFKKLDMDTDAIGLSVRDLDVKHFCTPKGARLIGWAGVDGIHYCFIRGHGETVFAVSPMNDVGRNVFPIARTFEDLLRLLLACGDLAALEQAHQWDEEQFDEFLSEIVLTPETLDAFEILQSKLGITPMDNPFSYIRNLQDGFNYGELNFSREYYEALCAAVPADPPRQWRVTLDGNFRGERGKAGIEIPLNVQFSWDDEIWHVPAAYLFSSGIVIDFCVEVNEQRLKAFFEIHRAQYEQNSRLSHEEEAALQRENPVNIRFTPSIVCNGERLRCSHSCGLTWISEALIGSDNWTDPEAQWILTHYGYDKQKPWVLRRCTFTWEGRKQLLLEQLQLLLERSKEDYPALRFEASKAGQTAAFCHPITGKTHTLTIHSLDAQALNPNHFHDPDLIFPTHFTSMTYSLNPELPQESFCIRDCDHGDSPKPRNPNPQGRYAMSVGAVAMLRNADEAHTACSSLHFEAVEAPIQWSLSIRHKPIDDLNVTLLDRRCI